jgi:MinD-like ATPase involved in chromosome partitioning or flagellar assembly
MKHRNNRNAGNSGFVDSVIKLFKILSPHDSDVPMAVKEDLKSIAFYSTDGNSGTTTLAVNTAIVLASKGVKVCLADLDIAHSNCFRYLIGKGIMDRYNCLNKFSNTLLPLREFLIPTSYYDLKLFAPSIISGPADWCSVKADEVTSALKEMSTLFDCIIIDAGGDLNYDTTIAALQYSDKVYSIIPPQNHRLEQLGIIKDILVHYGIQSIHDVIQTRCTPTNKFDEKYLNDVWKLNLVYNFPESNEVMDYSINYIPFGVNTLSTEEGKVCLNVVASIVDSILKEPKNEK